MIETKEFSTPIPVDATPEQIAKITLYIYNVFKASMRAALVPVQAETDAVEAELAELKTKMGLDEPKEPVEGEPAPEE